MQRCITTFSLRDWHSTLTHLDPSFIQWRTNILWDNIVDFHPQAYLWLGDAVYVKEKEGDNDANLRRAYSRQLKNKGYQRLLSSGAIIEGIYDDHDMSTNDGHKVVRVQRNNEMFVPVFRKGSTSHSLPSISRIFFSRIIPLNARVLI